MKLPNFGQPEPNLTGHPEEKSADSNGHDQSVPTSSKDQRSYFSSFLKFRRKIFGHDDGREEKNRAVVSHVVAFLHWSICGFECP